MILVLILCLDPWRAVTWSLHVVWGEPGEATETDAEAETDLHTMLETASPKESKDKNMITKQAIVQHETHEIKKMDPVLTLLTNITSFLIG